MDNKEFKETDYQPFMPYWFEVAVMVFGLLLIVGYWICAIYEFV